MHTRVRYVHTRHNDETTGPLMVQEVKVWLEVTLQDMSDERPDDGPFEPEKAADDLAAYADDHLGDLTRKEFEEPWRVINVERVRDAQH